LKQLAGVPASSDELQGWLPSEVSLLEVHEKALLLAQRILWFLCLRDRIWRTTLRLHAHDEAASTTDDSKKSQRQALLVQLASLTAEMLIGQSFVPMHSAQQTFLSWIMEAQPCAETARLMVTFLPRRQCEPSVRAKHAAVCERFGSDFGLVALMDAADSAEPASSSRTSAAFEQFRVQFYRALLEWRPDEAALHSLRRRHSVVQVGGMQMSSAVPFLDIVDALSVARERWPTATQARARHQRAVRIARASSERKTQEAIARDLAEQLKQYRSVQQAVELESSSDVVIDMCLSSLADELVEKWSADESERAARYRAEQAQVRETLFCIIHVGARAVENFLCSGSRDGSECRCTTIQNRDRRSGGSSARIRRGTSFRAVFIMFVNSYFGT
jgi:hypothetical protein